MTGSDRKVIKPGICFNTSTPLSSHNAKLSLPILRIRNYMDNLRLQWPTSDSTLTSTYLKVELAVFQPATPLYFTGPTVLINRVQHSI